MGGGFFSAEGGNVVCAASSLRHCLLEFPRKDRTDRAFYWLAAWLDRGKK